MFDKIIPPNSTMVGELFEYKISENAMKSHEQVIFDHIIPSNSTIVGGIYENVDLQIPKNAMKSH